MKSLWFPSDRTMAIMAAPLCVVISIVLPADARAIQRRGEFRSAYFKDTYRLASGMVHDKAYCVMCLCTTSEDPRLYPVDYELVKCEHSMNNEVPLHSGWGTDLAMIATHWNDMCRQEGFNCFRYKNWGAGPPNPLPQVHGALKVPFPVSIAHDSIPGLVDDTGLDTLQAEPHSEFDTLLAPETSQSHRSQSPNTRELDPPIVLEFKRLGVEKNREYWFKVLPGSRGTSDVLPIRSKNVVTLSRKRLLCRANKADLTRLYECFNSCECIQQTKGGKFELWNCISDKFNEKGELENITSDCTMPQDILELGSHMQQIAKPGTGCSCINPITDEAKLGWRLGPKAEDSAPSRPHLVAPKLLVSEKKKETERLRDLLELGPPQIDKQYIWTTTKDGSKTSLCLQTKEPNTAALLQCQTPFVNEKTLSGLFECFKTCTCKKSSNASGGGSTTARLRDCGSAGLKRGSVGAIEFCSGIGWGTEWSSSCMCTNEILPDGIDGPAPNDRGLPQGQQSPFLMPQLSRPYDYAVRILWGDEESHTLWVQSSNPTQADGVYLRCRHRGSSPGDMYECFDSCECLRETRGKTDGWFVKNCKSRILKSKYSQLSDPSDDPQIQDRFCSGMAKYKKHGPPFCNCVTSTLTKVGERPHPGPAPADSKGKQMPQSQSNAPGPGGSTAGRRPTCWRKPGQSQISGKEPDSEPDLRTQSAIDGCMKYCHCGKDKAGGFYIHSCKSGARFSDRLKTEIQGRVTDFCSGRESIGERREDTFHCSCDPEEISRAGVDGNQLRNPGGSSRGTAIASIKNADSESEEAPFGRRDGRFLADGSRRDAPDLADGDSSSGPASDGDPGSRRAFKSQGRSGPPTKQPRGPDDGYVTTGQESASQIGKQQVGAPQGGSAGTQPPPPDPNLAREQPRLGEVAGQPDPEAADSPKPRKPVQDEWYYQYKKPLCRTGDAALFKACTFYCECGDNLLNPKPKICDRAKIATLPGIDKEKTPIGVCVDSGECTCEPVHRRMRLEYRKKPDCVPSIFSP